MELMRMRTKREVLEIFAENGTCGTLPCTMCEYAAKGCSSYDKELVHRLAKIGAKAILKIFPKKKKPLLSVGTKIKFEDGSIAKIVSTTNGSELEFNTINGYTSRSLSYLLDRAWEVIEAGE